MFTESWESKASFSDQRPRKRFHWISPGISPANVFTWKKNFCHFANYHKLACNEKAEVGSSIILWFIVGQRDHKAGQNFNTLSVSDWAIFVLASVAFKIQFWFLLCSDVRGLCRLKPVWFCAGVFWWSACVCGWLPLPCTVVNQCPTTHPQTPPQRSLKPAAMAGWEYSRNWFEYQQWRPPRSVQWDYIELLQFECWSDCQRMIPLP